MGGGCCFRKGKKKKKKNVMTVVAFNGGVFITRSLLGSLPQRVGF